MTMIIALASPRVAVPGMEWITDAGRQIAAVVVDADGEIQGLQMKNQSAEGDGAPNSGSRADGTANGAVPPRTAAASHAGRAIGS